MKLVAGLLAVAFMLARENASAVSAPPQSKQAAVIVLGGKFPPDYLHGRPKNGIQFMVRTPKNMPRPGAEGTPNSTMAHPPLAC